MASENDTSIPSILCERDAAAYLQISPRTLQSWRVSGKGPAYLKLGSSVRYNREALTRWLDAQTYASTAARTVAEQAHV